jgi:hypothetical protein
VEGEILQGCGHEVGGGGLGFVEEQGTRAVLVEVVTGPEDGQRSPAPERRSRRQRTRCWLRAHLRLGHCPRVETTHEVIGVCQLQLVVVSDSSVSEAGTE